MTPVCNVGPDSLHWLLFKSSPKYAKNNRRNTTLKYLSSPVLLPSLLQFVLQFQWLVLHD